MKRLGSALIILLATSLSTNKAQAQLFGLYVGGGYNYNAGNFKEINYMLDQYASQAMVINRSGWIPNLMGWGAEAGFNVAFINIGFNYLRRNSSVTFDLDPNLNADKHAKLKYSLRYETYSISLGGVLRRKGVFRPVIGANFDLAYLNHYAQFSNSDGTTFARNRLTGLPSTYDNVGVNVTPFFDLRICLPARITISLRPYYIFPLKKVDIVPINNELNVMNDPAKVTTLNANMSSFGLDLRILLRIIGK